MGLFLLQKAKLIQYLLPKVALQKLIRVQKFFYRHSEWRELGINFLKAVLCDSIICNRGSPERDSVSTT